MYGSDDMKMKLLDHLEQQMDQHDVNSYMDKKGPAVAELKVSTMEPEPSGEPTPSPTPAPTPKDKPMYMNPEKEKVLKESEEQASAGAIGDRANGSYMNKLHSDNDPILMRGQFAKFRSGKGGMRG